MRLVTEVPSLANLVQLCFRHPDYFQAGSLHNHIDFWEDLLTSTDSRSQVDWLRIIREGVGVHDFFPPFKGHFKGKFYDSAEPPISCSFPNAPSCDHFSDFIDSTILAWVSQGDIRVHGLAGTCSPLRLVLLLMVKPSKPRLCHGERFLNLWIRDLPFK